METVYFITHPDVLIEPETPVPDWRLNPRGLARTRAMLAQNWVPGITHVASSTERKAIDGAAILAARLNLVPVTHPGLGENDRSSTGYLLMGVPISRAADQPPGSGGYFLAFDRSDLTLRHDWRPIDG